MTLHVQFVPSLWQWRWRHTWWESAALAIIFVLAVSRMFNETPFFYFQF